MHDGILKFVARTAWSAIALSVFSFPVHANDSEEPKGWYGQGHHKLHPWYNSLKQPGTGIACCDDRDCRPTRARTVNGRIEVMVDGEWVAAPPEKILKVAPPDLNSHVCAARTWPWQPKIIYCVILGAGA